VLEFFAGIVSFLAFLILGLTGFGSALIMIPLLLLFLDIKEVLPATKLVGIVILAILVIQSRHHILRRTAFLSFSGAFFGAIVGTYFLASFQSVLLKKIFGIFVILFSIDMLLHRVKRPSLMGGRSLGIAAGILSGLTGALFGMGGPPIVIYFNYQIERKESFRATLLFFFLLSDLWVITTYLYTGLIRLEAFKLFSILFLPALLGMFLGSRIHSSINEDLFRKAIASILIVTGILLILR
jgi:uncharacterized membrane protein YfcA